MCGRPSSTAIGIGGSGGVGAGRLAWNDLMSRTKNRACFSGDGGGGSRGGGGMTEPEANAELVEAKELGQRRRIADGDSVAGG
jgi:hypothetical protein